MNTNGKKPVHLCQIKFRVTAMHIEYRFKDRRYQNSKISQVKQL